MPLISSGVTFLLAVAPIPLFLTRFLGLWMKRRGTLRAESKSKEVSPMQMDDMEGPVTQLTIFLYDHKRDRAEPLYHQILKKAKEEGMKGVTVFRGIEGYGRRRRIHSTMLFETLQQLPFMILMIDTEHKINAFLPTLKQLLQDSGTAGGIYTLSPVMATAFHPGDSNEAPKES